MTGIDTCFLVDLDVEDSPRHKGAVELFNMWRRTDQYLAVYSHVFLEYQHIITDPRRFSKPLSMAEAVERTWYWIEQDRIRVIHPTNESFKRAQIWLSQYHLGRNRLVDTHMAAAYAEQGVSTLWTANRKDFELFNVFELPAY